MRTIRELRQELGEKVAAARAILDKAHSEQRARTSGEEGTLATLDKEMDTLERDIARAEREERIAQPQRAPIRMPVGDGEPAGRRASPSMPMTWTDQETGKELRSYSLARGENLTEAFAARPEKSLSLGRMIIGSLRSEWPRGWEAEQRAVQVGVAAQGGFVVPEAMGSIIPLAAANAVTLQAGAEVLEMPAGVLKLGRQLADPAANWYGELPAELALTDPTFGLLTLSARTLAVRVLLSIQWVEDAQNGPQLIEEAVARSLGLAFDSAILNGIAGEGWDGLRQWATGDAASSLNEISMGTNGAQLTSFAKYVEAIQKVLEGNYAGELDALTTVAAPRTWGTVEGLLEATTNAPLKGPDSYNRLKKLVSTQIPITETQGSANNASTVYVGDFRKVLVGMRTAMRIEATRQGGEAWKRLGVEVRGYVRLDWAVTQPKHLTRIIGVIP